MNVLVIGGAGYVGTHIVKELLDHHHLVRIYDRRSPKGLFSSIDFRQGDILDSASLDNAMRDIDVVINLAGQKNVSESNKKPDKYSIDNVCGTINILNAMARHQVKYMVFASTSCVYGKPQKQVIDETTPTDPLSYYAFTKQESERFLAWYDKLKGIKFVSLRYFNVAGYDTSITHNTFDLTAPNLIPACIETAYGKRPHILVYGTNCQTPDKTCVKDYIHVSDVATANIKAIEYLTTHNQSQIFNIGSGSGYSVAEVINEVQSQTGKQIPCISAPQREEDSDCMIASISKAQNLLKWTPQHSSLKNIITSTLAVYQQQYSHSKPIPHLFQNDDRRL